MNVVEDQLNQSTWTADVADQIVPMLDRGITPGIYHATSRGQTTWFGSALEIFRSGMKPIRDWREAFADAVTHGVMQSA